MYLLENTHYVPGIIKLDPWGGKKDLKSLKLFEFFVNKRLGTPEYCFKLSGCSLLVLKQYYCAFIHKEIHCGLASAGKVHGKENFSFIYF